MDTLIVSLILLVIIALSAGYVIRAKKRGRKCIGCPEGGCGCCSCGSEDA